MISFDDFVMKDGSPIYIQIIMFIKHGIVGGGICDGDELPSRRMLSVLLGVNPNTIQKAYKMLEDEGLIQSHSGAKSFMVLDDDKIHKIRKELLEEDVKTVVLKLKQMRLSKREVFDLIEIYWE